MELISLIFFLIVYVLFAMFSKSDLYAHEHDSSLKEELDNFDSNFKVLQDLDINNNYTLITDHIYNTK